jgi:Zn-dependent peptidase ImmA (M78 family)
MEQIENVNFSRLQWCCQELGISVDRLARECNVPEPKFDLARNGKPSFTFNQLRRIASFLGRGVLFFLEKGEVNPEAVHSPQFRTVKNQKSTLSPKVRRLIENVERQRDIFLSLLDELNDPGIPNFEPPILPSKDLPKAAAITREWLGLRDEVEFSEYRSAVEARGVLVFLSNGFHGKWQIPKDDPICGFSLIHPVCPLIFVKKYSASVRQTFTLMHELAHLLLHQDSFIDEESDLFAHSGQEREANDFAGLLLVPDAILDSIDVASRPKNISMYEDWLMPYRRRIGVSSEVLLIRMHQAGLLSFEDYRKYAEWKASIVEPEKDGGNRSNRFREPIHVFGDPYVRTVLESFHARNISLARASTYLDNLKISDVRKLERAYANA